MVVIYFRMKFNFNVISFPRRKKKQFSMLKCSHMLKSKEEVGVPDISKYYWACHLVRVVDWKIHGNYLQLNQHV